MKRLTNNEFITRANIIHHNRYNYSLVDYINNKIPVIIICKKHGEFPQRPNEHLDGCGCPCCGIESQISKIKYNNDIFIEKADIVHNYSYDYSLTDYKSHDEIILIICKEHGKFEQFPVNHLQGYGCSHCNASKGEISVRKYLIENNIDFSEQHEFPGLKYKTNLKVDFYLPEQNTCIEYDGIQHFESVEYFGGDENFKKILERDSIKNKYCEDNNIRLIRIPYTRFKNINEILSKNISKNI